MDSKLKLKVSRMFRSSLDSCRSKSISDVAPSEQPFFFPENRHHHHQLIELFSPKPPPSRPFPSFCRPKSPEYQNTHLFPRTKLTGRSSFIPPAKPVSPATTMFNECNPKAKHKRHRNKSRKTRKKMNEKFDEFFSSVGANYYGWYSSEDEDEKQKNKNDDETTFFSSKSMSSDSSTVSYRASKNKIAVPEKSAPADEYFMDEEDDDDELMKMNSPLNGKVKDSFAVIKRSNDPYNDFRTSMVEMIVEKQIFGSEDLENLLQCFLALNSVAHHTVIIQVFTEIWETLFSD